ncbi:Rv0361 family membrane protein [Geodermatophilus sp. SYSU D00815]
MSTGPYLYDEGPEPLHTGTARNRRGLLVGILAATVLVAVAAALALPLVKGSASEQAREVAGVFVAALQQDDVETAYGLLCAGERARVAPEALADEYLLPGTGEVVEASDDEVAGEPAQRVEVAWTEGGATAATTFLTVVNEGGAKVCGTSAG